MMRGDPAHYVEVLAWYVGGPRHAYGAGWGA